MAIRPAPESITDDVAKLGWLAGVYVQDEWKLTDKLKLECRPALRPDVAICRCQSAQPAPSLTYKPFEFTTFHVGYARYFTPPVLVEAAPANIALFNGTTGAPASGGTDPGAAGAIALFRRRRRSENSVRLRFGRRARLHACSISASTPITRSRKDLLDNGTFGQALVLSALQLRQGHQRRRRVQRQIPQRQFPGLWQPRRRPGESHQCRVEPISVRQRHAARRSRRLDRIPVHHSRTGSIPITISS